MDLTDIQNVLCKSSGMYFILSIPWDFSKHILSHKANLYNYKKKIEIISCILSDYYGIKLEINSKRSYRNYTNTWRLNNIHLNDQWVIEEIKEEIKTFLESNEWKYNSSESLGYSKDNLRGKFKYKSTHNKQSDIWLFISDLMTHLKGLKN
jgi:hypothetical protein